MMAASSYPSPPATERALPELGELTISIALALALAFDATRHDNPELARLNLKATCRRMVASEPGSHDAIIHHLKTFGDLNCLSPQQFNGFTERIREFG